jgi:phosphoglycolate phosphatase-like HAD superfamily hydrolase
MEKVRTDSYVMIGDSVFDCEAAGRAGVPSIALLTGGFGASELREAGAAAVFDSIAALRDGAGKTPLSA